MSRRRDLLIELGCEELPARQIGNQAALLAGGIGKRLLEAGLVDDVDGVVELATPRRLAIRVPAVAGRQEDRVLERKGPAESAAFDENGRPTRAAEGFARSVGLEVDELERVETEQGRRLFARVEQPGRPLSEILSEAFDETIRAMAGARSMRWSDRAERFLRPVRWLVALHGEDVVELEYFGLTAGRESYGHRIHAPGPHAIAAAGDYEAVLREAFVIADPRERERVIEAQIESLADAAGLKAVVSGGLLEEVAGLTEWPVAVLGHFDEAFLEVPEEAIISSMEQHQKSFALRDAEGRLAPAFIAVANIESEDRQAMTAGFERVIRPRLADARFFWDQDRRTRLADKRERLDGILFQERLGSVGDKVARLERLAPIFARALDADAAVVERAAALCKCDLVTEMVGEFPELQGTMGRHYAEHDGEDREVAQAIESHYRPRHAADDLPADRAGLTLALIDRLDSIVGVFAAGQKPRAGKDPFALRRAALGVIRILDATATPATLAGLVATVADELASRIEIADGLTGEVEQFIMERLRPWAAEAGIETNTIHAVAAGRSGSVADFMARARAVQQFADDPAVAGLIAANKRASNLLKQADIDHFPDVDESLLEIDEERRLFDAIVEAGEALERQLAEADYPSALMQLSGLREPVDRFFDEVMVMCDDERLRSNRLALLARLRKLFLDIADVAKLGR
ncbi:MAG: glycine--tRNA ligase subunit beta [Wenzhouxiangella sp.]